MNKKTYRISGLFLVLLLIIVEEAGTSVRDFFGVIGNTELALRFRLLTETSRAKHFKLNVCMKYKSLKFRLFCKITSFFALKLFVILVS